jgi:ABC-2 type transport system permease protein
MTRLFKGWRAVFSREMAGYFATPIAPVFLIVFLASLAAISFYLGNFFGRGRADLASFFAFHPWLFLFFAPAVAMRLWAEERRSGTVELLLTLPITTAGAMLGKFLAAWAFTGLALLLTTPVWITVAWLGDPDHGVIIAGYIGSFHMIGAYLAIALMASTATRNQVVAFVAAVLLCFVFMVAGLPIVLDALSGWAPLWLVNLVGGFSFLTRFEAIQQGVVDARDLVFFLSLIGVCLTASVLIADAKREQG